MVYDKEDSVSRLENSLFEVSRLLAMFIKLLTETYVPGRKSIETTAIAFMAALSCMACIPTRSLHRAFF